MRTKVEILESEYRNALKSTVPEDIALIHSLLQLEVLIDLRDSIVNIFGVLSAYYEDGITPK